MVTSELIQEGAVEAKLYTSKLKNMRRHLETLLAKKIRIELEIKELRKALKEKEINYERNLKLKLNLEAHEVLEPLVESGQLNYMELAEELTLFKEFDREVLAIQELLQVLETE